MSWFKREEKHDTNDWIAGFEAGFRVGYDQAFSIVYDQIKKSFDFSADKIRAEITDEIYANFDQYVEAQLEKRGLKHAD